MADYVLKTETAHYFVSPLFFIIYAKDFLKASSSHDSSRNFSPVKYYLVCHSIELSLKAFLLLKGVSKSKIKNRSLGYDLSKILEKCESLGINKIVQISDPQKSVISELNEWYSRKGFEYFEIKNLSAGANELPDVALAQKLATLLINQLEAPCTNEANK